MSVLARIRHRFFALRSMSPARRCATPESSPRSRWECRCRQLLSSDFSVLQLNSAAADHVDRQLLPRPTLAKEIGFARLKNSFAAAVAAALSAVVCLAALQPAETATITSITPSTAGTINAGNTVLLNNGATATGTSDLAANGMRTVNGWYVSATQEVRLGSSPDLLPLRLHSHLPLFAFPLPTLCTEVPSL